MRLLCRVPSLTTRGKSYAIRMTAQGPACDCPAFDHSPEPKGCKHLPIYEAALRAVTRCHEAGHGCVISDRDVTPTVRLEGAAALGLCRQCVVDLLAAAAMKVRANFVPAGKLTEVRAKADAKVRDVRERAKRKRERGVLLHEGCGGRLRARGKSSRRCAKCGESVDIGGDRTMTMPGRERPAVRTRAEKGTAPNPRAKRLDEIDREAQD